MVCDAQSSLVAEFHGDRSLGKMKSLMPGSVKLGHTHRAASFSSIVVYYCLHRYALKF